MGTGHDVGKAQVHAATIIYRIEKDVPETLGSSTNVLEDRTRIVTCILLSVVAFRLHRIVRRRGYNDLHLLINKSTLRNCTYLVWVLSKLKLGSVQYLDSTLIDRIGIRCNASVFGDNW